MGFGNFIYMDTSSRPCPIGSRNTHRDGWLISEQRAIIIFSVGAQGRTVQALQTPRRRARSSSIFHELHMPVLNEHHSSTLAENRNTSEGHLINKGRRRRNRGAAAAVAAQVETAAVPSFLFWSSRYPTFVSHARVSRMLLLPVLPFISIRFSVCMRGRVHCRMRAWA